ncbi:helix-turn-helix domain-containing protein [Amycolatopsis sp. cg5]|uniref:helix-turn-helix domain-containing protein n=1 Tax=Amycolatopsis sp. cg5 TaxID=3238802 RepID=UPI003524D3B0
MNATGVIFGEGVPLPLGELIRLSREGFPLSLREAAKRMDMSPATLAQIESGRRPVKGIVTMVRLADGLGLPRTQVFEWAVADLEDARERGAL